MISMMLRLVFPPRRGVTPAIVFNDMLTFEATLSCEPTVSSLNDNEINFRISFDESDDEDYMVIYDENSFSYKIISVNNLKTDFENDNDKVNMPSLLSPEPEEQYGDLAETMIWYMLKKTCVELIRAC
ncbi:hypothetical protein Tco_1281951 [Tanacetum coccineum]